MSVERVPQKSEIAGAVVAGVQEVLAQRATDIPVITPETRLVGRSAVLDSLGLVTLIVDLEQRIETDFGVSLSLANERAMSQAKSPFRSVESLTEYICELIAESGVRE
jgi:acyl carrier protein